MTAACATTNDSDFWADLEGDFEAEARTPAEKAAAFEAAEMRDYGTPAPLVHFETCSKCRGSGRFRAYSGRDCGPCFVCKGEGKLARKTSPEARAKARERAAARKVATVETWAAAHPDAYAWIAAKGARFRFAAEMGATLVKYGHLTDNQLATVERLRAADAERDAARVAEQVQREAAAPTIQIERVAEAISTALGNGIKRPILRLAGFKFSPAPATGRNAGAIYVKSAQDGEYLGKVEGGLFKRAFGIATEVEAQVVEVASDPEAAAVAYGKQFGSCACCGRELSDPESVARGIGPICATKFGW